MKKFCIALCICAFLPLSNGLSGQGARHPLDPLNWQEYWTVLEVLQENGHLDQHTRFSIINLKEPRKQDVLNWEKGQPVPRQAEALIRQEGQSYRAIVDLAGRALQQWDELKEQPNWLDQEFFELTGKAKEDPRFIEAMKKRGYDDLSFLNCIILPPGYFGTEEQKGRRIGHMSCSDNRGVRNTWSRKIEGITAVIDMNTSEVLRVEDEGVVPVPEVSADYDPSSIGRTREVPSPVSMEQPLGHGFKVDGFQIEWQNWKFHIRPDQRVGKVVSQVGYKEDGTVRPVLYQGNLSEIFVPYMDPSFTWYPRNFLDSGEFSAGGLAKPLLRGIDCPNNAVYFDALISDDFGRPKAISNIICVFERYSGDMSWRHWAIPSEGGPESRRKQDLVVRSAAVLGNYDYVFDWRFQQDGSIRVAVGASGIVETKMVKQATASGDSNLFGTNGNDPDSTEEDDAFGRYVDPNIVAVNHDHYFSFRLDLDVDGTTNSLLIDRLRTKRLPEDHPRRSVWVRQPKVAKTESDAKMNINLEKPALWRVISHNRKNHVGYHTSYQLMPVKTGRTLLSPDDYPRLRAGFIDYHLWATPYNPDERYAAGELPTLSKPGEGLPKWTKANRLIEETDIVLWHTVGMHHLVRTEDWPVMPVLWHEFELRPFDFFDRNPALDLPE